MKFLKPILLSLSLAASLSVLADVPYNAPGALNPIIPGYFADPTVKKFGDTYYIYATTDGSGAGFGPAQLWTSKDFVNWTLMPMNWPDSHWIWAPDVMQSTIDNKYYYLYCQPCQLHLGVSESPRGPWHNVLGDNEAVLVPDRFVTNAITLDGQTFVDDDGSVYMYWGTWGIYPGFGCGAGKLNPDMKSFYETRLIPNTEVTDFFEAPFVIKRDSTYYFMYSSGHCEDHSYRVQYATSDHPLGPYTYRGCILETNSDGTIHGPGHHSVLKEGENYYILYHRHDNPHSNRGFHRQLAMDKLVFDKNGLIEKVVPTHEGIRFSAPSIVSSENLAFGKPVRASSHYDADFKPEYAVDDNNGTLWRPATMGQEWLEIDLGNVEGIKTIWTQWEYGTQYYQYIIETSIDGKAWTIFADKRNNHLAGSPMVDFGDTKARYVRIKFTGGQKRGFPGAIWNVKVFGSTEENCPQQWIGMTASDWNGIEWENNEGMLGGVMTLQSGAVEKKRIAGRDALVLSPNSSLVFDNPQISDSKPHTISAMTMKDGQWRPLDLSKCVKDGKIIIESQDKPLVITNLRYYNWIQSEAEKEYDASTDIVRIAPADNSNRGLVVDICFDGYAEGDTIPYFENGKGIKGYFEAIGAPGLVKTVAGRRALEFDGSQTYVSSFPLPQSLVDNPPYTIDAWILNPEIDENECIADFTTTHDELEKIMMVNGTEPRCGVMQHYGWYEDAGWKDVATLAGQWQHLYVCFDGRIERVYINDQLVSEKDIQLLVKPSQYVIVGRNAEREWPFKGYVNSIKLYDECIPIE